MMINDRILDDFGVPILENTIKPKAARVVRYRDGSFLVRRLEPRRNIGKAAINTWGFHEISIVGSNFWFIGLRENLNRKPWFLPSNIGFSCKFSHHPILWLIGSQLEMNMKHMKHLMNCLKWVLNWDVSWCEWLVHIRDHIFTHQHMISAHGFTSLWL